MGLIFILASSTKPKAKNNVQIDKYSKKNIFLNNKKLQITIINETKIPKPPAIDVSLSWNACGLLNWLSTKNFGLRL